MKYIFLLALLVSTLLADEEVSIEDEEKNPEKNEAVNFFPMMNRMAYSMMANSMGPQSPIWNIPNNRWPIDPRNPNNHPTHAPQIRPPVNQPPWNPTPIQPPIWINPNNPNPNPWNPNPNPWNPNNPNGHLTHPPNPNPWNPNNPNPNPWNPNNPNNPNGHLTHPPQLRTTTPPNWWNPNQRPILPLPEPLPPNWWNQNQQPQNPPNWWDQNQQPQNPPNWWNQNQQPQNPPNSWNQNQQPQNPPNWWDQNQQQQNPWQRIEEPCDDTCSCTPCTIIWICPPACSVSCCTARGFGEAETVDKVESAEN